MNLEKGLAQGFAPGYHPPFYISRRFGYRAMTSRHLEYGNEFWPFGNEAGFVRIAACILEGESTRAKNNGSQTFSNERSDMG